MGNIWLQLEKEYGCLVVIYAWKFISEERTRPTPNWTKAVASVIARHEDEALGKVPLALPAIGEEGDAKKSTHRCHV